MNALEILGSIAISALIAIAALVVAIITGKVELKKHKPEAITHECRLTNIVVYTFIKGDKKQTPPLCAYLDPSDYLTCRFDPEYQNNEAEKAKAKRMKEVGNNQCYIAQFNEKFDLL